MYFTSLWLSTLHLHMLLQGGVGCSQSGFWKPPWKYQHRANNNNNNVIISCTWYQENIIKLLSTAMSCISSHFFSTISFLSDWRRLKFASNCLLHKHNCSTAPHHYFNITALALESAPWLFALEWICPFLGNIFGWLFTSDIVARTHYTWWKDCLSKKQLN